MMRFLKSEIQLIYIKLFYILILLILVFPHFRTYEKPEEGLDNSWRIALELVKGKGLIFGQDVIFTYGPLGTLTQRLAISSTPQEIFLFDLFFFINLGILFYFLLPKPLKLYQLIIHFVIFLFVSSIFGEWIHFLFFYCFAFFGIRFLFVKNHWLLSYSIFIGIVTFYTKANYGIISLGTAAILIVYLFLTKRLTPKEFSLYFIGSILVLWFMSVVLKTNLPGYISSSFKVIDGYNEAQSLFVPGRLRIIYMAFVIWGGLILGGISYAIRYLKNRGKLTVPFIDNIFIWCCSVVFSFVLIKYAFVRADDGHISAFVKLVTLPLLFLPVFSKSNLLKICGWSLIALNICSYLILYRPIFGEIRLSILENLHTKYYVLPEYFRNISNKPKYNFSSSYPADVLQLIGNRPVDIVPNEVSEIYFNKLNYEPRPTLQSYQAYNEYLDTKNRDKYLSATAPDFVVYGVESLDQKYAWGDETQTLLALLERYKVVKAWRNRLLLQKQPSVKALTPVKSLASTLRMGQEYNVPADSSANTIKVLKVKSSYNWFGKLLKLFLQPSHLTLTITTEDGKKTSYNTVPILLEKGLIVNSKIENVQDARQFFENTAVQGKAIKSININENVNFSAGFSTELIFELVFYKK